jgi:hypothetical protein
MLWWILISAVVLVVRAILGPIMPPPPVRHTPGPAPPTPWLEMGGATLPVEVEPAEEHVTLRVEHPLLGGPFTLELAGPPDVPGRVRVWLDAADPALVVRFLAPARCAALGALAALGRVTVQAGLLEVELPSPEVASLPTDVVGKLAGVLVFPWPQLAFRTEPPGKARGREDPIPPVEAQLLLHLLLLEAPWTQPTRFEFGAPLLRPVHHDHQAFANRLAQDPHQALGVRLESWVCGTLVNVPADLTIEDAEALSRVAALLPMHHARASQLLYQATHPRLLAHVRRLKAFRDRAALIKRLLGELKHHQGELAVAPESADGAIALVPEEDPIP